MLKLRVQKIDRDGNVTKSTFDVETVARAESEFLAEVGQSFADDALHGNVYGPDPDGSGEIVCVRTLSKAPGEFLWRNDEGARGLEIIYRRETKASQRDLFGGLA